MHEFVEERPGCRHVEGQSIRPWRVTLVDIQPMLDHRIREWVILSTSQYIIRPIDRPGIYDSEARGTEFHAAPCVAGFAEVLSWAAVASVRCRGVALVEYVLTQQRIPILRRQGKGVSRCYMCGKDCIIDSSSLSRHCQLTG